MHDAVVRASRRLARDLTCASLARAPLPPPPPCCCSRLTCKGCAVPLRGRLRPGLHRLQHLEYLHLEGNELEGGEELPLLDPLPATGSCARLYPSVHRLRRLR